LASKIGQQIKGGEVFVLHGDLGFGKTAFVKGLVSGVGITEEVTSPSFTISNVYAGKELVFYHLDYYRIHEPGILKDELLELINNKKNVIAIEWPGVIEDVLPEDSVHIYIINKGDENRLFEISYSSDKKYLLKEVKK